MNEGALAFSNDLFASDDLDFTRYIMSWLESNISEQKTFVNLSNDVSYIVGKSDLFDSYTLNGKYPVYNVIFSKKTDGSLSTALYKTVSSIQL